MEYNYREAIKDDVLAYIREHYDDESLRDWNRYDFEQELNDALFTEDSVTGNASGSYTCNANQAKGYLLEDLDAEDDIRNMIAEFGLDAETIAKHLFDWEYWDVSLRCYLLGECIGDALDELEMYD